MTDKTSSAIVPLEEELATDRLDRFVEAIVETGSIDDAAKAAAYSDAAVGRQAVGRETVQKRIRTTVERNIKTEGLGLAWRTVKGLMKNGNPPAVQLGAAKLVFAMNGMLDGQGDDGRDKPLHEMSDTELTRFIERSRKLVEQGGALPVIAVKPDEGR